jgi:hypothetical protein
MIHRMVGKTQVQLAPYVIFNIMGLPTSDQDCHQGLHCFNLFMEWRQSYQLNVKSHH